jgi:hypothetical protein
MLPAGQTHHAFILAGRLLVPFGIALNVLSRCGTAKYEWFGHSPPIKCVDSICRDASLPPGMTEVGTELDRRFARIAVPGVIIVAGSRRSQVHVSKAVRPLSADRDAMAAWGKGVTTMHSLSSLAIVMLATLTLTAAAGAFVVWLFWLLTSAWHGDVGHFIDRPCLHPALWRLLVPPSRHPTD